MRTSFPFSKMCCAAGTFHARVMLEVAEHYYHFDGKTPINDQNRALIAGPRAGARWSAAPLCRSTGETATGIRCLPDTFGKMEPDGVKRALAFVDLGVQLVLRMPPVSGEYRARARDQARDADVISCVSSTIIPDSSKRWPTAAAQALNDRPGRVRSSSPRHSIPLSFANTSRYVEQLQEACRLVAEQLGRAGLAAGVPEPQRLAHAALARARISGSI